MATTPAKKRIRSVKKTSAKKKGPTAKNISAKKAPAGKNKLGVTNSLVNNINARKRKGISRPKKKSKVSRKSYSKMKRNWK